MKRQFNLEEYNRLVAEGKTPKIVTRNGKSVRILCTDLKRMTYCVVGAYEYETGYEVIEYYDAEGHCFGVEGDTYFDLFFVPEKHEGWAIVICEGNISARIYDTRGEAEQYKGNCLAIAHIEWEE